MNVYRLYNKRRYTYLDEVYATWEVAEAWAKHYAAGEDWHDIYNIEYLEVIENPPTEG